MLFVRHAPLSLQSKDPKEIFYKYDTFLFDWDGTIADSIVAWFGILAEELEQKYEIKASIEEIANKAAGYKDEPVRLGLEEKAFDRESWEKRLSLRLDDLIANAELFPGIRDVFSQLKDKKLAVVSSGNTYYLRNFIKKAKLENIFDVLVSANDVTAHKPDPEPILHALKLLNSNPASTIMLGDMEQDMVSAQNARVDTLFFSPKNNNIYDQKRVIKQIRPDYIISSWSELLS